MPLRILIADDSRTVRHSLHGLLEQNPEWEVCAEAVDGVDAVRKAEQCRPDIIILDFFMPGMTGVEAARVLGRVLPAVPILIVTLYITAELVKQAKAAGIKRSCAQIRHSSDLQRGRGFDEQQALFRVQAS